jgi:hypothetical protein
MFMFNLISFFLYLFQLHLDVLRCLLDLLLHVELQFLDFFFQLLELLFLSFLQVSIKFLQLSLNLLHGRAHHLRLVLAINKELLSFLLVVPEHE